MISRATPAFWRAMRVLSAADQKATRRAHRLFLQDPLHNSLRFKKLGGYETICGRCGSPSASGRLAIGMGTRSSGFGSGPMGSSTANSAESTGPGYPPDNRQRILRRIRPQLPVGRTGAE